ncbi:MAG TPA: hypothetical protein VJN92_07520 [Candidatus Acidoferrum sp.]|nr:hypothetical protein [Candidatus Acidoferrum sp.]
MHWRITALWGGKKVELLETQRAVTPFGGLVVFFEFLRRFGYCEGVRQHLPFSLTSPNAIDPVETFTAFLLSVLAGARRFAHTSLLRADAALHALLGISRFPIDDKVATCSSASGRDSVSVFSLVCELAVRTTAGLCLGIQPGSGFHGVRALRSPARCLARTQPAQARAATPAS